MCVVPILRDPRITILRLSMCISYVRIYTMCKYYIKENLYKGNPTTRITSVHRTYTVWTVETSNEIYIYGCGGAGGWADSVFCRRIYIKVFDSEFGIIFSIFEPIRDTQLNVYSKRERCKCVFAQCRYTRYH